MKENKKSFQIFFQIGKIFDDPWKRYCAAHYIKCANPSGTVINIVINIFIQKVQEVILQQK